MSSLTLRLDADTLQQRGYVGIEVGIILEIVILSDLVMPGIQSDATGWIATWPHATVSRLQHVAGSHYAFSAAVSDTFRSMNDGLPLAYLLLATTPPVTLVTLLSEEITSFSPMTGAWVYGLTSLRLSWPDLLETPLNEVIQVRIADIRRLILQPGPDFGQIISMGLLPPAPLGPDQLFLDVELTSGLKISPPPTNPSYVP